MADTLYANDESLKVFDPSQYRVTFLVKGEERALVRSFTSPYQARVFADKIKRSKRCTLVSCPLFN